MKNLFSIKSSLNYRKWLRRILSVIIMCLMFYSCIGMRAVFDKPGYTSRMKKTLSRTVEMIDSTGSRSVIIVPMVHVGAAQDYEKVAVYLDGLRSRGYHLFFEGVTLPDNLDSCHIDTLRRKFRKLLGVDTQTLYPHLARKHKGWIVQNLPAFPLGTNEHIVDLSLDELVSLYEQRYEPVVLEEFDLQCPLGSEEYGRHHSRKRFSSFICSRFYSPRDSLLKAHVLNDGYDKIAVIYGSEHCSYLKNELRYRYGYHLKFQ